MDIAAWLRSLGLERYEPALRENEIDLPMCCRESDRGTIWQRLGLPLGPRRKLLRRDRSARGAARARRRMLRAIADLRADARRRQPRPAPRPRRRAGWGPRPSGGS